MPDDILCEICNIKPAAFQCLDCGKKVCVDEISKHFQVCHGCFKDTKQKTHDHGGGD